LGVTTSTRGPLWLGIGDGTPALIAVSLVPNRGAGESAGSAEAGA
jgi:hypothetical protein